MLKNVYRMAFSKNDEPAVDMIKTREPPDRSFDV